MQLFRVPMESGRARCTGFRLNHASISCLVSGVSVCLRLIRSWHISPNTVYMEVVLEHM